MKKSKAVVKKSAPAKRSKPRFGLIGDIVAELKKVTWLSRREWLYLTGLVLIATVIMGLILGVIDYGFTRLVDDIFLAG
jgi:preprotein translocase subunit SecE